MSIRKAELWIRDSNKPLAALASWTQWSTGVSWALGAAPNVTVTNANPTSKLIEPLPLAIVKGKRYLFNYQFTFSAKTGSVSSMDVFVKFHRGTVATFYGSSVPINNTINSTLNGQIDVTATDDATDVSIYCVLNFFGAASFNLQIDAFQIVLLADRKVDVEGIIATTKQSFDVTKPGSALVAYTNQLTCPLTQNNIDIFGVPQIVSSQTQAPYTKLPCKIVENGLEIIPNGQCQIMRTTKRAIMVNVYQEVLTFWDAIDNKLLSDITGDGINNAWGTNDVENYRTATSGVVAPVMNYGAFNITGMVLNADSYLPSVYLFSIIDKIFSDAGYTKAGAIFSDAEYLAEIIAFSRDKFEYAPSFSTDRSAQAKAAGGQVLVPASVFSYLPVQFATLVQADKFGFWNLLDTFKVVENDPTAAGKQFLILDVFVTLDITVAGGTIDLGFATNGGTSVFPRLTNIGTGVYTFSTDVGGAPDDIIITNGDAITVYVTKNTTAPSVTINSGKVYFVPRLMPNTGANSYVYFNKLLPDMTQKEFLQDFAITYGQVFDESRGVITCKGFDDIIKDRTNSRNMTGKRDTSDKENSQMEFVPPYAQVNKFKYSNIDSFVVATFGEGSIDIANKNLAKEKTLYDSPFNNTDTQLLGGILMANVPIYAAPPGTRLNFPSTPGLRKLLIRNKYSYEPGVKYGTAGLKTTYFVAYFDDPAQSNSMRWQTRIEKRYPQFRAILQKAKIITEEYILTDQDVVYFSPLYPWFDTDSYYIVNTIKDYAPGQKTKVILLKA